MTGVHYHTDGVKCCSIIAAINVVLSLYAAFAAQGFQYTALAYMTVPRVRKSEV